MFVKLTQRVDNTAILVNLDHVAVVAPEPRAENDERLDYGAILMFAQGQKVIVSEPPEKILDIGLEPVLTPPAE